MADLGWPELAIIALAVVLLFGWKRMPDMARSLGRSARIFRSEMEELKTPGSAPTTRDPATSADERAAAADDRAAAAEAEAARLREELEARRHRA